MVLQVSAGRMVGRDAELGRLLTLLDDAEAGRSVAALVSGDAGVGKSRLVSEVTRLAAGRGFTVLSGQCAELGDSVPYLPLADALRGAAQSTGVRDALSSRPALGRLLPEAGDGGATNEDRSGLARQQMFGAVLGLLTELAAVAPVLLVLEDLHWADASTRDLVTFLSRMLHRERVALIGTYRTDDLHRRHPLRPVVAELQRLPSVTSVELAPLGPSALAEHLTAAASGRLDATELNDIVARAEGNAYYAEELLAASIISDPAEHSALPAGLAALLLSRVEQLSDATQQVLRAAAVAGRRADDELVQAASGLAAAEYEGAVREAFTHQLLVPDGTEGYVFRHALLREAVYADLLPGERTRLHATMSLLLSDEQRLAVPGTAAELAQHSLASHDIPGAFAASVRAGDEAERLGAPAEAHRHYDQALALWERVTEPEKTAGMARGKLGLLSATNAADSGDYERAVHLLRRLRQVLAVRTSENAGPDDINLASRIGERLASYLLLIDDPKALTEAIEVARATVDATPGAPPTWQYARAVSTYAHALLIEDDFTLVREWAERAFAAARDADAPWVQADALVTLGFISYREGQNDEAIKLLTEAHKQARQAKVLGVELRAAYHLARAHLERGDLAMGAAVAHEGTSRAYQTGLNMAPYGLDVQHLHFQCHFADGKWDHAQKIADGFPVRVTNIPEAFLSSMALFIDVARDNPAAAERRAWIEPFWSTQGFDGFTSRGLLAEYALWHGDTEQALAHAETAITVSIVPPWGYTPSVIRPAAVALSARADRAISARASGDDAAASVELAAASELRQIARQGAAFVRRPKYILGPEGRGWLARAEAEYGRASGDNDPQAWQAVLDAFGPDYVYEVARTRWRLAEALAEAGRRDEAAEQWRQAAQTADKLKARPLRAVLADLARRARIGTVSDDGHDDAVLASLTSREREVLRLIAAGRSNREIASVLFIAPKTASVHVSNILAKLGAASRTEAAAIAHREGLTSQPSGHLALARRELGEDLLRAPHRRFRADVGGADLRIPVEVIEQLGDALLAEPGGILADLGVAAGQQPPAAVRIFGLLAGYHHAPADDTDGRRIPPRRRRRAGDHADRLADLRQVGAAGGDPARCDPPGPLHGRPGHAAEQHRRSGLLHRPGILPPGRDGVELTAERADLIGPQRPQHG
jgi:DNA-binding NarL/FixJ family response regulator